MSLKTCSDMAEAIPLEPSLGLYLKPISRIKINVQLPRLSVPGQSISSWHVMEKLKETVRPDTFLYLKSLKIAPNVIKFEGELETKTSCDRALARLRAAGTLKVSGFAEKLQIRAAHAACSGPTRHDWEAFFRDAKGVNEMKPGERPDTIHLEEMPLRWFAESSKSAKPSEKCLQKAFGTFGKIRRLEIQRNAVASDNTFGKTSSLHSDLMFEVYIQYEEYVEFSIAMDSLRGKKLLYKEPDGKVYSADIKVDFDRTNYLSDKCIKMREAEAKKLNHSLPPNDTKTSKDDTQKSSKLPSPQVKEEVSAVAKDVPIEKTIDKSIKKEKVDHLHLEEQEKAQKEAKLLIKELLRRAEKHKRKMDEKSSAECVHQESHKELKELKEPTKKLNVGQSKMCVDRKRGKDTLSFLEEKKVEKNPSSKSSSGDAEQESKKPKGLQKNTQENVSTHRTEKARNMELHKGENKNREKRTEVWLEKRQYEDEAIDSSPSFLKTAKKQKLSQELPRDRRKKTQLFYEVKKEKPSHKEDREVYNRKQIKMVTEAHNDERSRKKDVSIHRTEKARNMDLHKGENKSREKESTVHSRTKEKRSNSHNEQTKGKESVTKSQDEERKNREKLILQEHILKEKLLKNMKAREAEKMRSREKLRRELAGRKVLKSVLVGKNHSLHKRS